MTGSWPRSTPAAASAPSATALGPPSWSRTAASSRPGNAKQVLFVVGGQLAGVICLPAHRELGDVGHHPALPSPPPLAPATHPWCIALLGRSLVDGRAGGIRSSVMARAKAAADASAERRGLWQAVDARAAQVDVELVAPGQISSRESSGRDPAGCGHDVVADRALVAQRDDDAARSRSGRLAWSLGPGRGRPGCRPRTPNGPMVRFVLGG